MPILKELSVQKDVTSHTFTTRKYSQTGENAIVLYKLFKNPDTYFTLE